MSPKKLEYPERLRVSKKLRLSEAAAARRQMGRAIERECELGRLKSIIIAHVSHQFRTPLGVIASAAEILDSYFERLPAERRREQLQDILDAARQMADLIDKVSLPGAMNDGKVN